LGLSGLRLGSSFEPFVVVVGLVEVGVEVEVVEVVVSFDLGGSVF
jgi:hypothetical protein